MKKIFSLVFVAVLGVIAYASFNSAGVFKKWSFNPLAPIAQSEVSGGNLIGKIVDDGGTSYSNLYNNGAIDFAELKVNETDAYTTTAGLRFTAGGSKWVYIRNYPEAYGGPHLNSNNKDLKMFVIDDNLAGNVIILKACSNKDVVIKAVKGCGDTVSVNIPANASYKYDYYMVEALSDTVVFNLPKYTYLQEVSVAMKPKQVDNAVEITNPSPVAMELGQKDSLFATATNPQTPIIFTSLDPSIVKISGCVMEAVGSGEVQVVASQVANPYFKAAADTITVNVAKAQGNLVKVISDAVAGKAYGDTVTVTLDAKTDYQLDTIAPAGLVNLIINGNGAIVAVSENGQLTAMQSLILNNINFDCANGTKELVALDGNPDSILWCKNEPWKTMYVAATGKNVFFNEGTIAFNNCNVASLHKSLFGLLNKKSWALRNLIIDGSIIQFDYATGNAPISMEGSGGNNIIKDILFQNSTFYNTQQNSLYFLRYAASGGAAQPGKIYTAKTPVSWKMFNNTFALNNNTKAKFANNYTSINTDTLTWQGNVFYSVYNLNKTKGSCILGFANTDNVRDGVTLSGDAAYGTADNTLITIPTEAFDFDADKLLDNFGLLKYSYAFKNKMGDPRWLANIKKTYPTRTWDFSNIPNDYKADWDSVKADTAHWAIDTKGRCCYLDTLKNEELYANGVKLAVTNGLFFSTSGVKKILLGNGSAATYKCIQAQKGTSIVINGVHAADTLFLTKQSGGNKVVDGVACTNTYPATCDLLKGTYDTDTLIILADGDLTIKAAAGDARIQKIVIKAFDGDYVTSGLDYLTIVGNPDVQFRIPIDSYDSLQVITNNKISPVTLSMDTVGIITIDEQTNKITPVAPGTVIVTMNQAAAAGYLETSGTFFVQVLPGITTHTINAAAGEFETVVTPNALGYVQTKTTKNWDNYYIMPEYATWMEYINRTNGYCVVTGKKDASSYMCIDYREGANDSVCKIQLPNGPSGYNPIYTPTYYNKVVEDERSMNYYVTETDSVKFYYSSSASKAGALKIIVYCGEDSITEATGVQLVGKNAGNGQSATLGISGLDPSKAYRIEAHRVNNDVLVYAVKFRHALPTGIKEVETEDANAIKFGEGIYNLRGQKVNNMIKGEIYVIDGKKFIAK